jgi:hypothetical protein
MRRNKISCGSNKKGGGVVSAAWLSLWSCLVLLFLLQFHMQGRAIPLLFLFPSSTVFLPLILLS